MQRSLAGSTLNPRSRDFGTPGRVPTLADPADSRPVGFKGGERRKLNHQLPNPPGSLPNTRTLSQGAALAPVGATDPGPATSPRQSSAGVTGSVPGRSWEGGYGHTPIFQGEIYTLLHIMRPSVGTASVVPACLSQKGLDGGEKGNNLNF